MAKAPWSGQHGRGTSQADLSKAGPHSYMRQHGRLSRLARRGRQNMQERNIQRVAVVGTGTIGMSWAAIFLARGLTVSATDPAPEAEARLRHFIDAAWPVLARLRPIAATPPHQLLTFCADPETAVAAADFVQESA